ncbi:46385_t:CDS:2 [Gigaspora margarita]|uniref:46385_t:CDS:1 n=1 Tax=Gigaspora margarita TaxID=4874 RepID=A0ABN7VUV4_GIGMA|nr:46385_t:CDS:2 [Gigaspora margarita]
MTEIAKKKLANQIKEDLQKDLEKIKKDEKNENGNYVCSWSKSLGEGCSEPRGNEWRLTFFGSLETKETKYKERKIHGRGTEDVYHFFSGYEKGTKFHLKVREEHPNLTSIGFNRPKGHGYSEKHGHFFLIKGFENILLEKYGHADSRKDDEFTKYVKETYPNYFRNVELKDKITIAEADNQKDPEKNEPVENKPIDNSPNSQLKELNDKTLLQYFQKNDIKSIKLENEKLIIERNDNSTSTNLLTNFCELTGIDRYLENKTNKVVSRRELELSNNSDTTPTAKPQDNSALWIGCGIGGVLIITVIAGLLLKKKRIKKH